MTNEVSIFNQGNSQLPAHLQEVEGTNNGMITSGESIPRISIKGLQFQLKTKDAVAPLAPKGQHLDVVVLAVDPPNKNVGKAFFESGYSGNSDKPDCSSANGVVPDHWIDNPQHTACATCPKAVWGSAINAKGNEVKACSDHKRLIVTPVDNIGGDIAVVQVPPTSLKNLSGYGRQLNKHKAPLPAVITRMSFDQQSEHPMLCFDAVGYLPEDQAKAALARAASDELQDQLHTAAEPAAEHETAAAEVAPQLAAPEPEVPTQELVMTAKAAGATLEQFRQDPAWTDELLIQHGYAEYK